MSALWPMLQIVVPIVILLLLIEAWKSGHSQAEREFAPYRALRDAGVDHERAYAIVCAKDDALYDIELMSALMKDKNRRSKSALAD